jgi:Flp pilus assembly protein TadD
MPTMRIATEGRAVRTISNAAWAAVCLLAVNLGGQSARGQGVGSDVFGQTTSPKPSWSQRLLGPLGFGEPTPAEKQAKATAAAQAEEARRLKHDPLALDRGLSAPTPDLMVSMAEMALHGGNAEQARQLYQKAIAEQPKNLNALLGAARMEDREGRLDVAVMLYQRAAAAHPKNPTVLNDLGLCLARQGKLPAAERVLVQAVQLEPTKPLYRNNLAKVEVELNRIDAACQHLAAVYPPPVVNYNMGVLLYERGRTAEAQRFLLTAAGMDPALGAAQTLLAEIRAGQQPMYQVARASIAPAPHAMVVQPAQSTPVAPQVEIVPHSPASKPNPVTPVELEPTLPAAPQIVETTTPEMPAIDAPTLLPPVN